MAKFLQLALWNVNGLSQHTEELKTFISIHNVDVMLLSEMHFTEKKLYKSFQLYSLPYEPSSRNCYINKKFHQASAIKQL
jgi:exonuclease III